jgi:hypothetical protein
MKKMTQYLAGLVFAASVLSAQAGDTNAWLALPKWLGVEAAAGVNSAYVFRGMTLNDGTVIQGSAALRLWIFKLGGWVNVDMNDYQDTVEVGTVSEERVFVSGEYSLLGIRAGAQFTQYMDRRTHKDYLEARRDHSTNDADRTLWQGYLDQLPAPASPDTESTDDREFSAWLAYDAILTPWIAVHRGLDGTIKDQNCVETGLNYHFYNKGGWAMDFGVQGTYFDRPDGESGWSHVEFSQTVTWKILRASFHHVVSVDDELLVDAIDGGPYDIRNYGTIELFLSF